MRRRPLSFSPRALALVSFVSALAPLPALAQMGGPRPMGGGGMRPGGGRPGGPEETGKGEEGPAEAAPEQPEKKGATPSPKEYPGQERKKLGFFQLNGYMRVRSDF